MIMSLSQHAKGLSTREIAVKVYAPSNWFERARARPSMFTA
jgi:hypothetical protein